MDWHVTNDDLEWMRDFCVRMHGKWSANMIVNMLVAADCGYRRQDLLAMVRGYLGTGTKSKGRPLQTNIFEPQIIGSQNGSVNGSQNSSQAASEPIAEPNILTESQRYSLYITSWLRHSAKAAPYGRLLANSAGAREEKIELDEQPWAAELRPSFAAFADTELAKLGKAQRVTLGRIFALLFANYRVDGKRNEQKGVDFAAQIARMANTKRFADLTARELLRYGARLRTMRNCRPVHSIFDVEAVIEYEAP